MIDEITVFTITVKWDPVDCMYQNGVITEYIINKTERMKQWSTLQVC